MGPLGIRYHRDLEYRLRIINNTRRFRQRHPDNWKKYYYGPKHDQYLATKRAGNKTYKPARQAYHRQYYQELKYKVLSRYANGIPVCVCCGETYLAFLSLDHIDGGGSKHRKSIGTMNMYPWLVRNNFPSGYQVMCMNCQFAKKINGCCTPTNHIVKRFEN